MFRKFAAAALFAAACCTLTAHAAPYPKHDLARVAVSQDTPQGKRYSLDLGYVDQILRDLAPHAANYPTRFDSQSEAALAREGAQVLSNMLDVLAANADYGLLVRTATLNSYAHNLDVPKAGARADAAFRRLIAPADAPREAFYEYGLFLASAGRPNDALPHLEKARAAGHPAADFTLGLTQLALGNRDAALAHLDAYAKRNPADAEVRKIIEAVRSGKLQQHVE